jgi:hypothetical protein
MIHGLLVAEGWPVNKKRIERLWRQERLQVPPQRLRNSGQKAIGFSVERMTGSNRHGQFAGLVPAVAAWYIRIR